MIDGPKDRDSWLTREICFFSKFFHPDSYIIQYGSHNHSTLRITFYNSPHDEVQQLFMCDTLDHIQILHSLSIGSGCFCGCQCSIYKTANERAPVCSEIHGYPARIWKCLACDGSVEEISTIHQAWQDNDKSLHSSSGGLFVQDAQISLLGGGCGVLLLQRPHRTRRQENRGLQTCLRKIHDDIRNNWKTGSFRRS